MVAPWSVVQPFQNSSVRKVLLWQASGDVKEIGLYGGGGSSSIGDVTEEFMGGVSYNPYTYAFVYSLLAFDPIRNDFARIQGPKYVEKGFDVKTGTNKIFRIISDHARMNTTQFRLIVNDYSTYMPRQPLLSMRLVLNEDLDSSRRTIPAVFSTAMSEVPKNRQIDMTISNMESITFEFNMNEMKETGN
jgi:hypothetical protein